ncbi:shikimate dehydrogenase family protein [Rhizobium sp. Rhizsp42]|uniref:shikimate dehydrogenase family protein n=1 Tax=Rhizobium sp. Rhizsp42 TaxID=3243034 RepID=UPI0039B02484
MISGTTRIIAHLGYPTETFKSPLIYNPYFEKHGIDAVVVPMGCRAEDFPDFLRLVFRLSNIHGALITMPHKVTTMGLLDELSTRAQVAGACNAIRLDEHGRLIGDMFDGEGFVRGVLRKGRRVSGADVLVVGSGGVGSAIAASLAAAGVRRIAIFDANTAVMDGLMGRLRQHYPDVDVTAGSCDPDKFDIVVNATPLGMKSDDPLPIDVSRLSPSTFVGEVVMKQEITPFLEAARAAGCDFQVGTDMLFEQIPAYLEFFGFPTTTADELRSVARIG